MTIKDKLAHYEPKWAYFSTRWGLFSWWPCRRWWDFSRSCYTRNMWGTKLNSWPNRYLGRDWLSDSSGENHPLLCWKDKYRKLGAYSSKWRGETVVYSLCWHIVDRRSDLLQSHFYLEWCERFPIFLGKKQRKIQFWVQWTSYSFLQELDREYMGNDSYVYT